MISQAGTKVIIVKTFFFFLIGIKLIVFSRAHCLSFGPGVR